MGEPWRTRRPLNSDERALLSALVQDVGPRLLAYVRRSYGNQIDAEEIVAEAFCRAAANIRTVQTCERRDLYLLTIARNLCRDRFRRAREQTLADAGHHEIANAAEPADCVAHDERCYALRAAVAELPEAQREVVTLRLSTGLKFEEIAELLGAPLGTVLSRMHAAVQKLKHLLGSSHEP